MAVDEKKLEAIVSQQIELAKDHDKTEREGGRAKALDYYLGKMDTYVPAEANRSKVVSRDVADTIGWQLPQIIRVFTASDRVAVAEPVGPEDEQFAKEATDGLNHVFWKENKGYEVIYAGTWDALLFGNGIIKTYWDDTPTYSTSFHSDLSDDQLALLLQPDEDGDEPEVLQHESEEEEAIDPQTGAVTVITKHDLKIRRKKDDGRFVVEVIPPERFLIDQNAVCTDEAAFTAHWETKTRSELVAMGYDKDEIAAIPEAGKNQTSEEAARQPIAADADADASMELVDYYECFIRIDVDEDGEAELVRACYAGGKNGTLLDWEVWEDEHPFDDIPCEPIPHRWVARGTADETMDVQDIKTVLLRQGLNNVYWVNNPQLFAKGKINNPDALLNPTFGGVVWGDATADVVPLQVPFVAQSAFEAIAYQDEVIQRRTGVSRQTMALDPEALQNQTATAAQAMRDAGYSQVELLARNMAEWGWKKVFRKLLRLMIKHQDRPRLLMINGKQVQIDPRYWNADMDVTINVGLGTGSRDRDLAMLQAIKADQKMLVDYAAGAGMGDIALEMLPKVLHSMEKTAESAGIKNIEEFYPEITPEKLQTLKQAMAQKGQQKDPKIALEEAKAQSDMQIQQAKLKGDAQAKQMEMQASAQKQQQDIELQRYKIESDQALKQMQINMEMQLKREQLTAELQLKREQMAAEIQLKREMGMVDGFVKTSSALSSNVRPGGEPG